MSLSINLSAEETKLAESYAKIHSVTLSEAFKNALFEKIEDEFDDILGNEAYEEYLNNPKTYTHEEAWKEILG